MDEKRHTEGEEEAFRRDATARESSDARSLLYAYYLARLKAQGRGDEPFAEALRRALAMPELPTFETVLAWRDARE